MLLSSFLFSIDFRYEKMGGLVGKLKQRMRRFNIENRANAVISRSKPIPAPKTAAAIKQLKVAQECRLIVNNYMYFVLFRFDTLLFILQFKEILFIF